MGRLIKSLSLQMTPWWCFQVMDAAPDPPISAVGKGKPALSSTRLIIRADGKVDVYHRPVTASEVMRDHPTHLVCRSDAFTIGQRIPALAEGEQLEPGHVYFLLPLHFFQSVLSFLTLASSFAGTASALLQRRPFEVLRAPSGKLQIRVCDDFIRRIQEGGEDGAVIGRVCTTAALVKEYRLLVVGWKERQWKPKLETIREYSADRKGKLGGSGGAGAVDGVKRRRKKGQRNQGDDDEDDDLKVEEQLKQKKKEQMKQIEKKDSSTVAKHTNSQASSHKRKGKIKDRTKHI